MKKIFLSALFLLAATPAMAEGSNKGYGMGGWFERFDPVVAQYNQSGELFRIQGHCQSACTLFLNIRNVCIEPSARLLFHAGKTERGTQDMINSYNGKLRAYLVSKRIMESSAFHTISGRDMIRRFGYRQCP